jgi:hypothetical protein
MDFITVKSQTPERFFCFSQWLWGHHVHWTGMLNLPCTLKLGLEGQVVQKCELCTARMPKRGRWYLHVQRMQDRVSGFLIVPPTAARLLFEARGEERNLRGLCLMVHRATKNPRSELVVVIDPNFSRKECEQEELDPGPYLTTVFRQQRRLKNAS